MKHKVILALIMFFIAYAGFAGAVPDNGDRNIENMYVQNMRVQEMHIENVQSEGQNQSNSDDPIPGGGVSEVRTEPAQVGAGRLPVTWEIVYRVQRDATSNFGDIDFYLSKSFTMKIDEGAKATIFKVNDGDNRSILIEEQNPSEETIRFTTDIKGKYIRFSETRAEFVILFQVPDKGNYHLHFGRDTQRDCFNLVSVSIQGKAYGIHVEGELPRLEISGTDSRNTEIRIVPAAAEDQGSAPSGINYNAVPIHQEQYTGNTYWWQPSREIMGAGSLTKEGVIQYIRSRNSNPVLSSRDIGRLIDIYFDEARLENINRDIAIAQMLYATSFLSNQRTTNRNYGGLSSTPGWNGRFPNRLNDGMTEGVRAHIQHLKGYASRAPFQNRNVDPRYDILVNLGYLGSVRTFDQLYRRWSENPDYGNEIERILNGLYRFSDY